MNKGCRRLKKEAARQKNSGRRLKTPKLYTKVAPAKKMASERSEAPFKDFQPLNGPARSRLAGIFVKEESTYRLSNGSVVKIADHVGKNEDDVGKRGFT